MSSHALLLVQESYHTSADSLEAGGYAIGLRISLDEGADVAAFCVRPKEFIEIHFEANLDPNRQLSTILSGIIREFRSVQMHSKA